MKKYFIFTMLMLLALTYGEGADTEYGLWVPCEGENKTLSSQSKIIQMLDFAKELGTSDIFLQVYRRNHSWYASKLALDLPYQEISSKEKIDPLSISIKEAHERGLRIHAWFNVYWIGKDLNIPVVKRFGKDIITRDQKARSLADYENNLIPSPEGGWYSYGEDGYWLDPGDDRVQSYFMDIVKEVLQKYPELDGIHLDFFRMPFTSPFLPGSYYAFTRGLEFGYGKRSVELFQKKYGLDPLKMPRTVKNHLLWDQWRRDQITSLADRLHQMIQVNYPKVKLSSAVLPWPERSYFSSYQDWMRWVREGQVDFIVTMNYSVDQNLTLFLSQMAMSLSEKASVWIGLGPYLFEKDAQGFKEQFSNVAHLNPQGVVFFSYESLLKDPGITAVIKSKTKNDK